MGLFFVTVDVDMTGVVCVCVWMMSSSHIAAASVVFGVVSVAKDNLSWGGMGE